MCVQIVRKLEPTKIFARDDETTQFLSRTATFCLYGTPDVPVHV